MSDHESSEAFPPDGASFAGERVGTTLWLSWILPAAWWLSGFEVRYALVPWTCRTGQRWCLSAADAIAAALAAILWLWALHDTKKRHSQKGAFVAQVGFWLTSVFLAAVLVQITPDCFLDPCIR